LTGGVAIELHILRLGGKPIILRLNDLDFVAASFDSIPEAIGSELLLRHVHPHDPPGKNHAAGRPMAYLSLIYTEGRGAFA